MFRSRGIRTWCGLALLAFLAGGPLGPLGLLHATLRADPECLVEDGQIRHEVPAGRAVFEVDKSLEHCGICHWLSAVRVAIPLAPRIAPLPRDAAESLDPPRQLALVSRAVTAVRGRSPPALQA